MVAAVLLPKLVLASRQEIGQGDGGFYANVAYHLVRGDGLTTDLSLMHKGYHDFPHPTSVYPLWPLVLATAASVVGLKVAAIWLPTLLYFVAVLFAYLWGRDHYPGDLFPGRMAGLNAGHLSAAMLGINYEFMWFTSLPYTEGLAYALFFAALYRFEKLWKAPSLLSGAEMGLWAALIMLTRSQLLVVAMAVAATALAVCCIGRDRRLSYLMALAGFLAVFVALITPQYLWMKSFVADAQPTMLLRFDQARASNALSPIEVMVSTDGALEFITDRGAGLLHAFRFDDKYSYSHQFYLFQYALPLSLLQLLWLAVMSEKRRALLASARNLLSSRTLAAVLFVTLLAVGSFLSIHAVHKRMWAEWNFHIRHALVCIPIFFLCMRSLLTRGPQVFRVTAVLLCAASLYLGYAQLLRMPGAATVRISETKLDDSILDWIRREHDRRGDLKIGARQIQGLWQSAEGVGFHAIYRQTSFEDLMTMVDEMGLDAIVIHETMKGRFRRDRRFRRSFRKVLRGGEYLVFVPVGS